MTIEIIEFKPCLKDGNLKAFVDIKIGDILIKYFRIIQQKDQRAWVSVPQVQWKDANGSWVYENLITLPKELKASIEKTILEHYEREGVKK